MAGQDLAWRLARPPSISRGSFGQNFFVWEFRYNVEALSDLMGITVGKTTAYIIGNDSRMDEGGEVEAKGFSI
jgi:hypothetical protein